MEMVLAPRLASTERNGSENIASLRFLGWVFFLFILSLFLPRVAWFSHRTDMAYAI